MKKSYTTKLGILFIVFFYFSILTSYGQPRLILSRIGNKNRIIINEGEIIKLKVKGADNFVGGPIVGLRDSVIHFKLYDIHLDSISEISLKKYDGEIVVGLRKFGGFNTGQYGASIMVAGPMFLGADALNEGNVTNRTLWQSASIVGFGYLLVATKRKVFKIKGRNKVFIIN